MHSPRILLLALLVLLALQGPAAWFTDPTPIDERVMGPDSYMRLQRVMDMREQGHWYDAFQVHTNAPYGEQLHWTRPMDSLLYAGAWIGASFTDFDTALLYWGLAISPLILGITFFIWSWGTRHVLDDVGFLLSAAMLVLMPTLNAAFNLGRPDHHSLLMLLFVAQLAVFIRLADGHVGTRGVRVAGVLAALALWVSLESLCHLLLFGAALGAYWIWWGAPYLRHVTAYLVGLALALPVALILERPPTDWLTVQYDRLSIVHVVLLAAGAATWLAIRRFSERGAFADTVSGRARAAMAGLIVPALVMAVLFPRFFHGPFVDIASDDFKAWIAVISEYHATLPVDRFSAGMFFAQVSPALIAAGFICWRWRRADLPERRLLILLASGLVLFLPAALTAIRWSMYLQAVTWLPWTLATVTLARSSWRPRFHGVRVPAQAVLAVALVAAPVSLGAVILLHKEVEAANSSCDWTGMIKHLEATRKSAPETEIVLSSYFKGSEIVWRTGYRVVGAPYGNNDSLADTNDAFRAARDGDARAIVRRRGIDWILICPPGPEAALYRRTDYETFHARLESGRPPGWLRPVPLPERFAPTFKLFRVIPPPGRAQPARDDRSDAVAASSSASSTITAP